MKTKKKQKFTFLRKKNAYSVGFSWIFGLVSLFGLGILFITFDQVFIGHLVPVIETTVNSSTTISLADQTEIINNIDKYMAYWHLVPVILFFVVVVYLALTAFRKEGDSEFL